MHDLTPITPLGGTTARVDIFDSLQISENPDWALASIAARIRQEKPMAAAAERIIGVALPGVAGVAGKGDMTAFWTGPDQWMVEAPMASHEDLAARLKTELQDTASVTEQTDGWVRFDVDGPRAPDVFERLCPLDTRSMDSNTVNRTSIEHLGCFVLCREAGAAFSVLGPRSSAVSLHHALCTAAKSAL